MAMIWLTVIAWAGSALSGAGLNLRRDHVPPAPVTPPPPVRVHEFDVADPHPSCLNGQRIVFIGPSTSKFDYLALTYFAEYGRWPEEEIVQFGKPGQWYGSGPNPLYGSNLEYGMDTKGQAPTPPVHPCKTGSAEKFLWYTNKILNGHEVCDCYKEGGWQGPIDVNNQTENRVYDNGNTMIAYFQWFGDVVQPRGTFSLWPLQQRPRAPYHPQCPAGQFKGSWDWSMTLPQFISSTVSAFSPTHLVIDAAFWPIQPTNTVFWDAVAQTGLSAVLSTQGKVLWRTAPTRLDYPIPEHSRDVDTASMVVKGWKLYDASGIVMEYRQHDPLFAGSKEDKDVFQDTTHLTPKAQSFLMKNFLNRHVCPIR